MWISVDGVTWSRVPHDEAIFGGEMADVAVVGTVIVAVGHEGGGNGTRSSAAVWTSADGVTWSRIPDDDSVFGDAAMSSVTAAGSRLVAMGHDVLGDDDTADAAVVWVATPEN